MQRASQQIDVSAILAERRFGALHLTVLVTCALALFAAGFDAEAMAASAADVARALALPPSGLAQASAWSALGILVGLLLGALGDRVGRRRVVILSLLLLGAASFVTSLLSAMSGFKAVQLFAGLGIGALLPNALALTYELMPRRGRFALSGLTWIGFAAGSAAAVPIAASLLQRYQWPAVFLLGGILPVVLALVLWGLLPESPLWLLSRGAPDAARVVATLSRISRRFDSYSRVAFANREPIEPGVTVLRLFQDGRGPWTMLLWACFFTAALAAFLFDATVPRVVATAEFSASAAAVARWLVLDVAVLGGFAYAYVADRVDRFLALAAGLAGGAVLLFPLAVAGRGDLGVLLAAAASFLLGGAVIGLGVFAASSYPSGIRATGAGFALAAGRVAQSVASFLVPTLAARTSPFVFLAGVIVIGMGAGCISGVLWLARR